MILSLISGLTLGVVFVVFVLQNTDIITVTFFSWNLTGPVSLILLATISVGILMTALFVLPEIIKRYFICNSLKKENKKLEEELEKQKQLTLFAKKDKPTEEIISKIEQGAIDDSADQLKS
ncbi:MAG: lipopolysaccharide assembly protein LapA domain-containing protein [Candidatus Pacebacteria bacterium]|nr:lipopolysaccharide assembly protein LapA domain-containing protein [Candidatus Paceibacterota bacterium]